MQKFRNTIQLARTSWRVLQKDRELLLLPVLAIISSIVVGLVLVIPFLSSIDSTTTASGTDRTISPATILIVLIAVAASAIIGVFFNGALVAGAHERMTGGDPTVKGSISRATQRLPGLVPWALLNLTVGMILRALQERAGWFGQMILRGLGLAWQVAAFLTIPAIVIDDAGPIDGFKRSAGLLRKTWGENLLARVGFGILGFVLTLPVFLISTIFVATGSSILQGIGIGLAALWLTGVGIVMSALSAIFQTALYMYATTGASPEGFESQDLEQSFGQRPATV